MPIYDSYIKIRTQFEGTHSWSECPHKEVEFLKNTHRHLFKITVTLPVSHDNRDLEFFLVKKDIDLYLDTSLPNHEDWDESVKDLGDRSCEQLAKHIAEFLFKQYKVIGCAVEVSEDGENSGLVFGTIE